jgi:hypothetical protein
MTEALMLASILSQYQLEEWSEWKAKTTVKGRNARQSQDKMKTLRGSDS